ncbi:MAG: helix-turn-helix domain-containing protein [Thermoflexales bacterium]|nr:helix-turn-helix domain-containing protein [Thermoflexales bacterium]
MADQNAPTSPRRVRAAARRAEALRMRIAGASYREIAAQLGVSHEAARQLVIKALEQVSDVSEELRAELRKLELERLDAMLRSLWQKVAAGNESAINTALRIMERRAKLAGLDTADKINISAEVVTKPTLEELIALIRPKDETA